MAVLELFIGEPLAGIDHLHPGLAGQIGRVSIECGERFGLVTGAKGRRFGCANNDRPSAVVAAGAEQIAQGPIRAGSIEKLARIAA